VLRVGDGCGVEEVVFPLSSSVGASGSASLWWLGWGRLAFIGGFMVMLQAVPGLFRGALEVLGALMSCRGLCYVHVVDRA
jgi:hypothetical protein